MVTFLLVLSCLLMALRVGQVFVLGFYLLGTWLIGLVEKKK